jgi:uncharacterized protein (DUF1778 family)
MSGMARRTDRVEARVEPARAERIRFASALSHTSLSGFMVEAAAEKAEEVIAEHAYTLVPSSYFDELLASLDEPPEVIPELVEAAQRTRARRAFRRD